MPLIIKRAERRNREGRRVFICSCSNHFSARHGAGLWGDKRKTPPLPAHRLPQSGREGSEGSLMAACGGGESGRGRGLTPGWGPRGCAWGWGWTDTGVLDRRKDTLGREDRV